MDVVFSSDMVPIVWHDHYIYEEKCTGDYVGQYLANLTLAQIKSLDCSLQHPDYPQQQTVPGTRIPTLTEVLDLILCYGDDEISINIETKLDPLAANETLPMETYITDLIPVLEAYNFLPRTSIQSFDWRPLIGIHALWPEVTIVALLDDLTTAPDRRAPHLLYPWLGGIDLADFAGDWVAAAASIGASILSPIHGVPDNVPLTDPAYEAFVTRENTARAHELGLKMVPWTVDHAVTVAKLLDDGVDGIVSNYPEMVYDVAGQSGLRAGRANEKRVARRMECLAKASA